MQPMLDDIELPQVQEITTHEQRVLAEHKPPGMAGSLLQNLGRRPTRLVLWGVATGTEAQNLIDRLDDKFRAGQPLPFTADIVADAEIEQMVIDDLRVQDLAGKPERYAYVLTLREYIQPVEPEDTSFLDTDILDDAQNLMDDLVAGLDIGLDFATGLERFISPLSDLLVRFQEFGEAIERSN
ncbi:MAG: hypothetical protein RMX68_008610 [Aulosira sp. ZfuVER01]|nr:hypothetical protein [Aulosira sp. ZfuVER01]MDZ8054545.1 hypothetical protein [Aulosira sp. ZfuCHP01]